MKKIFTDEFLDELELHAIERTRSNFHPYQIYGKAQDKTGMTLLAWNEGGASMTYFGGRLADNNYFCVKKDGGTRIVFDGYVFSQNDVRIILNLTL